MCNNREKDSSSSGIDHRELLSLLQNDTTLVSYSPSNLKSPGELLRGVGYPDDVIDVFLDPKNGPTVVHEKEDFFEVETSVPPNPFAAAPSELALICSTCALQACLFSSHVNKVIVLKDGMRKLGT